MQVNLFNNYDVKTHSANKRVSFAANPHLAIIKENFAQIDRRIPWENGDHDHVVEKLMPNVVNALYNLGDNYSCRELARQLNHDNGFSNYQRVDFDKMA